MNRQRLFLVSIVVAALVSVRGTAAPAIVAKVKAISVANANQIEPMGQVEKDPYRITRGPKAGEVTFFYHARGVEILDTERLAPIREVISNEPVIYFAASRDGDLRAWSRRREKSFTIEEVSRKTSVAIPIGSSPSGAAFSPDGKLVALGNSVAQANAGQASAECKLFTPAGRLVHTLELGGPGGLTPVFSPDGKLLAVGNRNDTTLILDVATGKRLHVLDKRMTQEIAFSPDGKTLAAAYVDGTLALWDVATGKVRESKPSTCDEAYSVDWSPAGDLLVSAGHNGKVVLWDPKSLSAVRELDVARWVIQVRFTPQGDRLLIASAANDFGKVDRKVVSWGFKH